MTVLFLSWLTLGSPFLAPPPLHKVSTLGSVCFSAQGYSFMAPSILFKRNVVMDDPVQLCGGSERPGSAAVARSAMMKVG